MFRVMIRSILLTMQVIYGLGEVGAICKLVKYNLCLDFLFACGALRCWFGVLPPSFIGFVLKALPNSLESPL